MKMALIETMKDELIQERFVTSALTAKATIHWDTIEITDEQYYKYEELRIALDDYTNELRSN
jgi:hypothetical protein